MSVSKLMQGGLLGGFLLVCGGCEEDGIFTATPVHAESPPVYAAGSEDPTPSESPESDQEISKLEEAPATVVQTPSVPDELKLSPALAEIVRMVQAGVSEDVLLTYIDASTDVFDIGSDEIVFLTDLGVSENLLKRLIEHDALPESRQRKLLAEVTNSLPKNLAVESPATNVYPIDYLSRTATNPVNEVEPAYETQVAPVPVYTAPAAEAYAEPVVSTDATSYFYDTLSPYGSWVQLDGYGLCWQPTVVVTSPGWRPYFDRGRWIYSNCGWYWLSDYSWGWATFHYGRWFRHNRIGWCWAPDLAWGPSWVSWRYSSDYCGWAPLPPGAYCRPGIGFTYYGRNVGVNFSFGLGYDHFTFVPFGDFCDYSVYRYGLYGRRARSVFNQTTVVNNININNGTIINNGVDPDVVAQRSRVPIRRVEIRNQADFKGGNRRPDQLAKVDDQLVVYRPRPPQLQEGVSADPRPRPAVRSSSTAAAPDLVESPRGQANRESFSRPMRADGQVSAAEQATPRPGGGLLPPGGSRPRPARLNAGESEVTSSQSGSGTVRITRSRDELRMRGEGTTTGSYVPRPSRPADATLEASTAEVTAAGQGQRSRPDFNPVSRILSDVDARPTGNSDTAPRSDSPFVIPRRPTLGSDDQNPASQPFRPQRSINSNPNEDRSLTFTPRRRIIQPPEYSYPVTSATRPTQSTAPPMSTRPVSPVQPTRPVEPVRTPPVQLQQSAPSRPTYTQPVTPSRPGFTPMQPRQRSSDYSRPQFTPPQRVAPSVPQTAPSRPNRPSFQQSSGGSSMRPVAPSSPRQNMPARRGSGE